MIPRISSKILGCASYFQLFGYPDETLSLVFDFFRLGKGRSLPKMFILRFCKREGDCVSERKTFFVWIAISYSLERSAQQTCHDSRVELIPVYSKMPRGIYIWGDNNKMKAAPRRWRSTGGGGWVGETSVQAADNQSTQNIT